MSILIGTVLGFVAGAIVIGVLFTIGFVGWIKSFKNIDG